MKIPFLGQVKSENVTRKEFSYSRDKVALKFTLRTDTKNEMKCFRELLLRALEDVESDLSKLESKNVGYGGASGGGSGNGVGEVFVGGAGHHPIERRVCPTCHKIQPVDSITGFLAPHKPCVEKIERKPL